MSRIPEFRRPWLGFAALLVTLPLVVCAPRLLAGGRTQVQSPHGRFKEACADCHSAEGWKPAHITARFDHRKYGFALEGAHATSNCLACHKTLEFTQANLLCANCHTDPHRGELGTECARCHGARSFVDRGPMLHAHQLTRFPLTGSHATLDCESCHRLAAQGQMQFVNTPAECRSCHMAQYQAARAPDHVAGGFPLDCATCHSTQQWTTTRFDHDRTGFPLTGSHRTAACVQCHTSGHFTALSPACMSCHMDKYTAAQPPHPAAGFPASACANCHNTTQWAGASFNHNTMTSFLLTGAHVQAACASCHGDGVYQGKPTACMSCHMDKYDTATPNHAAAHFPPANCASCHNTTQWTGATFDHDTSWFPIYSGRHAGVWAACSDCHQVATDFAQFTCLSCHPHDDKATTDSHHSGVRSYTYDSPSCYRCHPRGSGG